MELSELKDRICDKFNGTQEDLVNLLDLFEQDKAFFPFNEYELLLTSMIERKGLSYQDYLEIRQEYLSQNPLLWLFEISAPRAFGEKYGQTLLQSLSKNLKTPTKKLDPEYSGQYDLWLDGIRIEVKASRVVDKDSDEPLYKKALSSNTKKRFLMNFQQLKPQCCDVFVWIAVYRNDTTIWIMNRDEVINHPDMSIGQHRGNKGNEGQLHITQDNIKSLDKYIFDKNSSIEKVIKAAAKRMKSPQI